MLFSGLLCRLKLILFVPCVPSVGPFGGEVEPPLLEPLEEDRVSKCPAKLGYIAFCLSKARLSCFQFILLKKPSMSDFVTSPWRFESGCTSASKSPAGPDGWSGESTAARPLGLRRWY